MKSNIDVISNIYLRNDDVIEHDLKFLEQVRGYAALSKLAPLGTTITDKLTSIQKSQLTNLAPCTSANNLLDEQTFGPVLTEDGVVWSCRCENSGCSHFNKCMSLEHSKKINRNIAFLRGLEITNEDFSNNTENLDDQNNDNLENDNQNDDDLSNIKKLDFEFLGLQDENITKHDVFDIKDDDTLKSNDENIIIKNFIESNNEYTKINDQNIIIQSPIHEKILVNAGPGTGKTYTAIERLKYIISNNLVKDYGNIVVICYTRAAKKVIETRIEEKIIDGTFSQSVNQIYVCTIDAFATAYLNNNGDDQYKKMDYEQRIEHFNSIYKKDKHNYFEYVIIDEIQDFVNHRALMVGTIIDSIKCGCLLLGDKCQAIYDYSAAKDTTFSVTSVDFYNFLYNLLPPETKKYELMKNIRQDNSISQATNKIREALLKDDLSAAKSVISDILKPFELEPKTVSKFEPHVTKNERTAILCRNNSEAEYVSCALHKKKIPHKLLTNTISKTPFSRWIGIVLWDYCENIIYKQNFINRYTNRVVNNQEQALHLFDILLNFSNPKHNENQDYIFKDELWGAMTNNQDIPTEMLQLDNEEMIVSTIHKSKGQEFDNVYLIKSNIDNLEEARVTYVGITRPKKDLKMIDLKSKPFFTRVSGCGIVRLKKFNVSFIKHMSMNDDIDNESVLFGDFYHVTSLQKHIVDVVKINDKLDLIFKDGIYKIYHVKNTTKNREKDVCLGELSAECTMKIKQITNSYPPRIHDIFVSDIITIPQQIVSENIPIQFKQSKFSLGLKINGFVKFDWKYGK